MKIPRGRQDADVAGMAVRYGSISSAQVDAARGLGQFPTCEGIELIRSPSRTALAWMELAHVTTKAHFGQIGPAGMFPSVSEQHV
jgi:hypothetical protein